MSVATPPQAADTGALHLTQILVSYELAARQLKIRDRYDWHQHVWKSFEGIIPPNPRKGLFAKGTRPEDRPRALPDFLCRLDAVDDCYRLIVLSATPPKKPDWCPTGCFRSKVVPEDFFSRCRYRFSLLANPTKKIRSNKAGERTKNGRRVPLAKREDLVEWLRRKAEDGGFSFEEGALRTIPLGRDFFHKDSTSRGTHAAVEFRGELTVTDPAKFRTAVASGIGSAKAFGFGLLVVAPVSTAD